MIETTHQRIYENTRDNGMWSRSDVLQCEEMFISGCVWGLVSWVLDNHLSASAMVVGTYTPCHSDEWSDFCTSWTWICLRHLGKNKNSSPNDVLIIVENKKYPYINKQISWSLHPTAHLSQLQWAKGHLQRSCPLTSPCGSNQMQKEGNSPAGQNMAKGQIITHSQHIPYRSSKIY